MSKIVLTRPRCLALAMSAVLIALVAFQGAALAQLRESGSLPVGAPAETSENVESAPPSIASSLGAYGDPGGRRSFLAERGITYSLTYIGEGLVNATGGIKRGGIYEGRLDLQVDADLDKLLGWRGATFHTNLYQIHGRGLSRYYLGNLFAASGIEAVAATRLFELWIEQKLFEDRLAIRVGQLAADSEFLVSQYAGLFVNGTFGWPSVTAANLPSGGPAYPLATPGIRVKFAPIEGLSVMAGLFNGDPAGPNGTKDAQLRDRSGFEFRTTDSALLIGELAWSYNSGQSASGLPGTIKLGGWHHFGRFDDQRLDTTSLSLADPLSSGLARRLRGNSGAYAVLDQMIYRVPGATDQGIGLFIRASGSPSDRNLINAYVDAGLTFKGLIPGRPDDTFGIAAGYAQISSSARGLDRDVRRFGAIQAIAEVDPETGTFPDAVAAPRTLVRSSEALIEVTYQAQIVPGWTIQPDFQYVFRPGGNVANPRDPDGRRIKDAAVFGLRSTIRY